MISVIINKDVEKETPLALGPATFYRKEYGEKETEFFEWLRKTAGLKIVIYKRKDNNVSEDQEEEGGEAGQHSQDIEVPSQDGDDQSDKVQAE